MRKTTKTALQDLENFTDLYKRLPSQTSNNLSEKKLAQSIANFKAKKRFDSIQTQTLIELTKKYAKRMPYKDENQKLYELNLFCEEKHRLPKQNGNVKERKLYYSSCQKKYYTGENLKKFEILKRKMSKFITANDVYNELSDYIHTNRSFPLESEPEPGHSLALNIKTMKSRNKFSDTQLSKIKNWRKLYGIKSGLSSQDQLLYQFLKHNLLVSYIKRQFKDKYEIDVLIKYGINKKIAIFYDGIYHQDLVDKDNCVNKYLIENDYIIYRFRENKLPNLIQNNHIHIINVFSKNLDALYENEYSNFLLELTKNYSLSINKNSIEKDEIIKLAKLESTSRKDAIKTLMLFIEACVWEGKTLRSRDKLHKKLKSCIHQNRLTSDEIMLYKFVKALYMVNINKW